MYSVDEDDGPARPVLVLSNPSSTVITVQVFDISVTAAGKFYNYTTRQCFKTVYLQITGGGVDYDSGPYTVTFSAGETRAPFNISINNDNIFEMNENFALTINGSSLPTGVTVSTPNETIVTIIDNEGKYLALCS